MKYIKSHEAYKGKRVIVEEATYLNKNNALKTMEHVNVKPAVAIVALTKEGDFVFIKEERTAIGNKQILEIPSGVIEEGETPKEAAIRELREETGYITDNIEFLTDYYSSCGFTNEKVYIYFANNLFKKTKQELDEDEEIKVKLVKKNEVLNILKNGNVYNASLQIALMQYIIFKEGVYHEKN